MKRKDALALLLAAGYHGDHGTFARIYVENRISYAVAKEAWAKGVSAKERGVKCNCFECKEKA